MPNYTTSNHNHQPGMVQQCVLRYWPPSQTAGKGTNMVEDFNPCVSLTRRQH
jgi:hypothetical protein